MEILSSAREFLLGFVMVVMAIILILALIRAIAGPRFTDRIVAINMIGTEVIIIICILAYLIGEQYLVDVALVYAMISFLAVVVMVNLYLSVFREKTLKNKEEAEVLSHEHGIEVGREEQDRRRRESIKQEAAAAADRIEKSVKPSVSENDGSNALSEVEAEGEERTHDR